MARCLFFQTSANRNIKTIFYFNNCKDSTFEKFKNTQIKYFLSFIILSSVIILLIDQPDLGQSILIVGIWIATVFISGLSLINIFIFFSIFLISLSALLFFLPEKFGYIINRLITFLILAKETNFNHLQL